MDLCRLTFALLIATGYCNLIMVSEEPACSRFHYEEKFLEKVIRLELKLEQILQEMKKWMDNSDRKAAKNNEALTETVNKHLERRIEDTVTHAVMKSSIPTVAFNARMSSSKTLEKDDVIIFDTVIENKHGGYDNTNGVFTAPHGGLYYFSAHVCVSSSKGGVNFAIIVNNETLAVSSLYTSKNSCSSVSVIATMSTNEQAFVKSLHHSYIKNSIEYRWSSFIGALLR